MSNASSSNWYWALSYTVSGWITTCSRQNLLKILAFEANLAVIFFFNFCCVHFIARISPLFENFNFEVTLRFKRKIYPVDDEMKGLALPSNREDIVSGLGGAIPDQEVTIVRHLRFSAFSTAPERAPMIPGVRS